MATLYPIQPSGTFGMAPPPGSMPPQHPAILPITSPVQPPVGGSSFLPTDSYTPQAKALSQQPTHQGGANSSTRQALVRNGLMGAALAGGVGAIIGASSTLKQDAIEPGTPRTYYDKEKDRNFEVTPRQQKEKGRLEVDHIIETDPNDGTRKAEIHYGRENESLINKSWGNASSNQNGKRMARVVLNDVKIEALYTQSNNTMDLTHVTLPKGQQITSDDARTISNTVPTLEDSIQRYETKAEAVKSKKNAAQRFFQGDVKHHLTTDEWVQYRDLQRLKAFKDEMDADSLKHLKNLVDTRANIDLPDAKTLLAKSVAATGEASWKSVGKNVAGKGLMGALIGAALGVGATIASKTWVASNPAKTMSPHTQPRQISPSH
jgi:hypothetical protein